MTWFDRRIKVGAQRWIMSGLAAVAVADGAAAAGPVAPKALPEAAAAVSGLQPVAVFGSDDRSAAGGVAKQFGRSIGLLVNARDRLVCTAFCVDDSVIATAAHCLFRTADDARPRLDDFAFVRGLANRSGMERTGIAGAAAGAGEQNIIAGSRRLSIRPPIDAARDWALVRLARPLCRGSTLALRKLGPEEIIWAAREKRLYQVGYHRDVANWRLTIASQCGAARNFEAGTWAEIARDFVSAEHLVLHTCDTGGASSGSPLLVETRAGPVVVGINVGTYLHTKVQIEQGEVVQRSAPAAVANTGVAALAFADRVPVIAREPALTSATAIRDLQEVLAARSFYRGPIDGRFNDELQAAIEGFESSAGLTVSGFATRTLLERLGGSAPGAMSARKGTQTIVTGSHGANRHREIGPGPTESSSARP